MSSHGKSGVSRKRPNNDEEVDPCITLTIGNSLINYGLLNMVLEDRPEAYQNQSEQDFTLIGANFSIGGGGGRPYGRGAGSGPGGPPPGPPITLADVGGLAEEISYLKRAVLFPLAHKNSLSKWGFTPPKGIMFYGPPGTGKTLLAKAMAHELSQNMKTKVHFIYRKGSDCFSKWFGESSQNLRKIFQEAEINKPSLIFFDEIDGLCPSRDSSHQTSQAYVSVATTLLGMMDQIKRGEIFVIGATNRLDSVDSALRRPGRFDKEILFKNPDEAGRKRILQIHTKLWERRIRPAERLLEEIVGDTAGFTGAYLENLCSETISCAINRYKKENNVEEVRGEHLPNVSVTREDWYGALELVGRPKANIFGSTLYVPQGGSAYLPLVSGIVAEVATKMRRMCPFLEEKANSLNSLMSFMIWDNDVVYAEQNLSAILPELLSLKLFQKTQIFQFNLEILADQLSKNNNNFHATFGKVVNQALSSITPCILYLPRFDNLLQAIADSKKDAWFPFIHKKLTLLRSRHVLILATATDSPNFFQGVMSDIFSVERSYKLRTPLANERRTFFQTLLSEDLTTDNDLNKFFGKALDSAVEKTEFLQIPEIVDLYNMIASVEPHYSTDKKMFMTEVRKIIDV